MKLPSLTSIVVFLVILGLAFLCNRVYTMVAIEGKKALKEATADIDAYDAGREKETSKKARRILEKQSSEARARKREKK